MNKQVRGFVVIWTLITFIIGTATFFGIYLTYNADENGIFGQNTVAIPIPATDIPEQVAMVVTNTPAPLPTTAPTLTPEPQEVADVSGAENQAEQQADAGSQDSADIEQEAMEQQAAEEAVQTEPEIQPTALPVSDTSFQLAVQVQAVIDGNPDVQRAWMNDVGNLGLNWYKQQIRWDEIETAPGEFDWGRTDVSMRIQAEYGFRVLATVVTTPEWAREAGADLAEVGPPADNQDYVNFLRALLERYPGQIHAIEVWNEQNIDREWASPDGLSAAGYVDLLRESFIAIKDMDPGIIVISGALSPTGGFVDPQGVVRAIDDFDFMDQLIDAGMLNYADCIGAHHNGYNISPSVTWDNVENDPNATFRGPFDNPHHSWSFRSTLQTYANKIQLAGGDQKLCVTEFGWPVTEDLGGTPEGFGFADDNTLDEQAEWIIEAIDNMIEWDIVWIASVWNLNYGAQAGWDPSSDNTPYSLIGPDFARRPAFDAIVEWTRARQEDAGS
ncbi:MAG: hypothetical protein RLP44_21250 [Aggregatilineales bacterium]